MSGSPRSERIADSVVALPRGLQTFRACFAPHFEGVPSFRALQNEPNRPVAIAIAGLLSLTAIATFTFILGRPIPYRPAPRNGPMSPIESVIERLNQTISPDSADSGGADAPEPASANTGRSEARPFSSTNAVASSGTRSATSTASQPSRLTEQNPNTSYSNQGPSPAVAASSPPTQGQPHAIEGVTQSAISPNMQASLPASVAANLSGWWTGSFRAVVGDADLPQWFVFKQDSTRLTGTCGPDSKKQYPIIHGLVAGDSVKFELNNGKRTFLYDLRVKDKELRGTVCICSLNETRVTKVWLERVQ